jgi:uncharacterized protein
MFIKIHKSYRDVVGICDKELIGKKFEQGKFQLDVKESFYQGKIVNQEQAEKLILDMDMEDATFNIVGQKSTQLALRLGIIQEEGIKTIDNIPFALALM